MTNTTILALFGIAISLLSLGIAATTMYLTWLRRGRLAMTKPSIVFFGHDTATPKIFIRTLLYSTAQRGKMVETMYAKLIRDRTEQVFGFWGYAPTTEISPGSGLYVGQTGVAANHHFVLSEHYPGYEFRAGDYTIQVFARQAGRAEPLLLSEIGVVLDPGHAAALAKRGGVLFKLDPDAQTYIGHSDERLLRSG